jgi:hypothetical protein
VSRKTKAVCHGTGGMDQHGQLTTLWFRSVMVQGDINECYG